MITLDAVSFSYENGTEYSGLQDVSLYVERGEVVLLCGESGSGKTTITRLVNGLIPHYFSGTLSGNLTINGVDPRHVELHNIANNVGSVFQNPRSQFYCMDTSSELAFGCENQGCSIAEIEERISHTVDHLQIESLMNRNIFKLSGGEKQKIACGGVHAVSPEIIVLDEPSSNLDPQSTRILGQIIAHWKTEGKTILIAEHRLYYLRDIADRMIYMQKGRIVEDMSMDKALKLSPDRISSLGLRPFFFESLPVSQRKQTGITSDTIRLTGFSHSYTKGRKELDIEYLELPREGITAVIGRNGSGKTTFAKGCCGLHRKFSGRVQSGERCCRNTRCMKMTYMVMQDVNHQLFAQSVIDEVLLSMNEPDERKALDILESLDLHSLKDRHPLSLSGGEKQRVAIAGAIASDRDILLFDEPTSGLDLRHMIQVAESLRHVQKMGRTVVIITHDLELILRTCDHVLYLSKGRITRSFHMSDSTKTDLIELFSHEVEDGVLLV